MKKVDVSIILSTKNFKDIEKINENFQNSQLNYEIIAVGPSKKNYEIDKLKIIQSFTKPVQCLEIAKNFANGEWVLIWSDDLFFLDKKKDNLKKLINLAKSNENSLISCQLVNEINKDLNSHRYDTSNLKSPILPIAAPLKNEWIKLNGFYDKNFIATLADIDLYLRLMSKGFKVKIEDIKIIEKHKSNYSLNSDYHAVDRRVLNKFWLKNINMGIIEREKEISSFNKNQLNLPQGPRGRWKFNNFFYYNYCLVLYFKLFNELLRFYFIKKFIYIFFKNIQKFTKKFYSYFF